MLSILGLAIGEACLMAGALMWMNRAATTPQPEQPLSEPLSFVAEESTPLQRQLAQAGFTSPSAIPAFNISKWICGLAVMVAAYSGLGWYLGTTPTFDTMNASICGFGFIAGYMLPAFWISKRQEAYKHRIELALPDALDLLQICMEAGQSLDQAIIRAARELRPVHPDLAAHLDWAAEAILVGMDRGEVFRRIAAQTENDDIAAFGAALVQSVRMGTPIAQTLTVYTDDLRDKRVRRIEGKANTLPTKMTLGTMMFTVPPLLLLLLTPAILRVMGMV